MTLIRPFDPFPGYFRETEDFLPFLFITSLPIFNYFRNRGYYSTGIWKIQLPFYIFEKFLL